MATGTVSRLWRWPVKSMAGEEVRALSVGPGGVGGDRVQAVLHEHKGEWKPLTAREAPGMLAWSASYPFDLDAELDPARPPHAMVAAPGGERSWRWGDPDLRSALEADLGRPVKLLRDTDGVLDVPRTLLVTTEGSLRALAEELGDDIDLRRFRPNLHLDLDAPPWIEGGWTGAELAFEGGVRLEVIGTCERCAIPTRHPDTQVKWPGLLSHLAAEHEQNFGVLARVLAAGRVAAGANVGVETSGSGLKRR
jgi:uncharacterized protein YcbX